MDDWPKPELLYALTPFEVAAGLRAPADAAGLLRALAVDQLQPLTAQLSAATSEQAMAGALASVLEWRGDDRGRAELVAAVVAACARLSSAGSRRFCGRSRAGRYADACAAVVRVAADHPGDLGLVALLLMRHEVLQPGQAVFMPAGGLHAYLRGTGIELLANSDNVVRAGLTGKHIDVPELLKLLDPVGLGAGPRAPGPPRRDRLVRHPGPGVPPLPARPHRALRLPCPAPARGSCCVSQGACAAAFGVWRGARTGPRRFCFISAADALVHAAGSARLALAAPGAP